MSATPRLALDATYFDRWYADLAGSPTRDAIVARTLGLPPELQSTRLLSWQGIVEFTEALRVAPDGLLVDLACGRGGYGIEIAKPHRRATARGGLLGRCRRAGDGERGTAAACWRRGWRRASPRR